MTQRTDLNSFSSHSGAPQSEPSNSAAGAAAKASNDSWRNLIATLILILLNLICYGRTLNGYFLADDFVHVAYLNDVFSGHFGRLLENFTGNWMNAWGTQFYRPLISLTLAMDFWLGKGSALPFHLSNTLYHLGSSIFLYFCALRLLRPFESSRAFICALAASMLFSTSPLHTEVVSWIIGRVDGVCLFFFLAALLFFLRKSQDGCRFSGPASYICFILSLLSKEMSVILPPLVVLTSFTLNEAPFKPRVQRALKDSVPFWLLLLLYFGVRFLALGTTTGGYGGSVGQGLSNSFLERLKSAQKILFPFNQEIISPFDKLHKQLDAAYKLAAAYLAARLFLLGKASKQLTLGAYCLAWALLSLAPAYQVFNITDSLMCSRFAYFATAPLSLLAAILISPLWELTDKFKSKQVWLTRISVALLLFFVYVQTAITIKNNTAWAHAGSNLREFRAALAALCQSGAKRVLLLNIPQRLEGAHMIYNGAMLSVLLSEPLSKPALASSVASFEPPTYGDGDLINSGRLRKLIKDSPDARVAYWDLPSRKLLALDLKPDTEVIQFDLSSINGALGRTELGKSEVNIDSPLLKLNALSCDFVICKLQLAPIDSSQKKYLRLSWSSKNFPSYSPQTSIALPLQTDGKEHAYFFPVSEHKSWLAGERIERLRLTLPEGVKTSGKAPFSQLSLLGHELLMPEINPQPGQLAEGLDGIYRPQGSEFEICVNARNLIGTEKIVLELSRPNSWFEHYAGTFRENGFSDQSLKRLEIAGTSGNFKLKRADFPQSAYYELRAFAIGADGKVIGFCSDPIYLQVN